MSSSLSKLDPGLAIGNYLVDGVPTLAFDSPASCPICSLTTGSRSCAAVGQLVAWLSSALGQSGVAGELVGALIVGMAGMALDPYPFDAVWFRCREQFLP